MSNMSYCRFENTLHDLVDCADEIGEGPDDLGQSEKSARARLLLLCARIADDNRDEIEELQGGRECREVPRGTASLRGR